MNMEKQNELEEMLPKSWMLQKTFLICSFLNPIEAEEIDRFLHYLEIIIAIVWNEKLQIMQNL